MSSERGIFSIYYGEGNVIYGPNGVDLSEFNCAVRGITRPHERTFESLCNWLMRGLRINQETHTVSVQCVINRTTHALIWELMPLASNEDWLTYLQNASHWQWPLVLLVSVHQNPLINIEAAPGDENIDEEVEEASIEAGGTEAPQGVADEGENIPFIVEQLQDEERELDEVMNADSSDDDDDVPQDWVSSDFSHLVVDDGSSWPSDCRENEIIQGARYHSIEEVKEAVKCWSLSLMREFKTVECKSQGLGQR
ncbi:hypothetical protein GQ55_5G393500 [Panicum hallii var. hallii]|uniref:Transposase MuDR N-terminal domain-containing protein n=1 Tax=Panicum hallii var. hallii TaxID=1504633 RepID=A0A2T7DN76_9POAL|nr:hypothetical protein GQ55_5G393500 [Panicum hallii var. hallii]